MLCRKKPSSVGKGVRDIAGTRESLQDVRVGTEIWLARAGECYSGRERREYSNQEMGDLGNVDKKEAGPPAK